MTRVLGIDLGGTKVLAGVVDTDKGHVLSTAKKRSHADPDELMNRLMQVAEEAMQEAGAKGHEVDLVGIGVAGQIDRQRGVILNAPNLAGMSNVNLASIVSERLGKPVRLFNDVEAAAAGEATFGAGQGHPDFVVVFVGTGIGGAIYRDGQPYIGATKTAGEIGHITVDVDGRLCGCGGLGHLEAYASRTAIVRTIIAGMIAGRESVLREVAVELNVRDPAKSGIRSKSIAHALSAGDRLTRECLETGARYLAAGLSSLINLYNPPLIILGGGLIDAVDLFFQIAAQWAKEGALPVPQRDITIVKAGLGDDSGIVGAAVLAARGG